MNLKQVPNSILRFKTKRFGLSFVEILIAILVVTGCAVPIIYMVSSTRTDTVKAINYLRAVELANEAIEWAAASKLSNLNNGTFSAFNECLVSAGGSGLTAKKLLTAQPSNPAWKSGNLMATDLQYSEQYNKCYFWRQIDIQDVNAGHFQKNLIKKVTVTIKWSEGKTAPINSDKGRTRQVQLSVLLLNDKNLFF